MWRVDGQVCFVAEEEEDEVGRFGGFAGDEIPEGVYAS